MTSMFLRLFTIAFFLFLAPVGARADFKVGFIGGFSGPGELLGTTCRNGFELAREEAHSPSLKIIYEDSQFSSAKTVAAFHKLTQVDKVDVVIVLGSASAAVAPLAESKQIPLIAWAGDPAVSSGRKWVVRTWSSAEVEGGRLATLVQRDNVKKPALVASEDNYSRAFLYGFRQRFRGAGVDLGTVMVSEMDFRSLLLKAIATKADSIVMCLGVGQSAALARQVRGMAVSVPLFGCETLNNPEEIRQAHGKLAGARFVSVVPHIAFVERYQKRFGMSASIGGAAIHYELFRLLNEIAAQTDHTPALMQKLLSTTNRPSVLGLLGVVTQGGDQHFDLPIGVTEIATTSPPY